jgi:hypothetical protein
VEVRVRFDSTITMGITSYPSVQRPDVLRQRFRACFILGPKSTGRIACVETDPFSSRAWADR